MELIFQTVFSREKQIGLKTAGAGKVDQGKFSATIGGDLQQGQRHSFTPSDRIAYGRGRLIQTADDIPHTLVDRLPAAILLELLGLVFPQEKRKGLFGGQHSKLRSDSPGEIIPRLQRIGLTPAIGIAVAFTLCEDLTKPAQIPGNGL